MDQQSGKQRKIMERETIISLKEIQTAYNSPPPPPKPQKRKESDSNSLSAHIIYIYIYIVSLKLMNSQITSKIQKVLKKIRLALKVILEFGDWE